MGCCKVMIDCATSVKAGERRRDCLLAGCLAAIIWAVLFVWPQVQFVVPLVLLCCWHYYY